MKMNPRQIRKEAQQKDYNAVVTALALQTEGFKVKVYCGFGYRLPTLTIRKRRVDDEKI